MVHGCIGGCMGGGVVGDVVMLCCTTWIGSRRIDEEGEDPLTPPNLPTSATHYTATKFRNLASTFT